MNLQEIKNEIKRMDPNCPEDDEAFKAQVVLLASAVIGPGIDGLRKFTGYPRSLLAKFNHNLRKSGVWRNGKVCANWDDEKDGGISFGLDTCVALGLMERAA